MIEAKFSTNHLLAHGLSIPYSCTGNHPADQKFLIKDQETGREKYVWINLFTLPRGISVVSAQFERFIQATEYYQERFSRLETFLQTQPNYRIEQIILPQCIRELIYYLSQEEIFTTSQDTAFEPSNEFAGGFYIKKTHQVFLKIKGATCLGTGATRIVKDCVYLNSACFVAQGVSPITGADIEARILEMLKSRRGIIHTYASLMKDNKFNVFQQKFEFNLISIFNGASSQWKSSVLKDKLNIAEQLLEGLSTISEYGVHRDLAPRNIVLRNTGTDQWEAAIIDFNFFVFHADLPNEDWDYFSPEYPPEHLKTQKVSPGVDVWQMGLVLLRLCVDQNTFCWWEKKLKDLVQKELKGLVYGWPNNHLQHAPEVLRLLIPEMLNPNPKDRISAKDALIKFRKENVAISDDLKKSFPDKQIA